MLNNFLIDRALIKARKSRCRFRMSALGFNKKGELIFISSNKTRFVRRGGSIHAEMNVMKNCGKNLKTIIIFRVGKGGRVLPIHPCKVCQKKADDLGIKIISFVS